MPDSFNYSPILPLVSPSRLQSYQSTFRTTTDRELYCTYVWSQYAAGALYPLFQNAEVTLRNAIDMTAKRRFGDFWWDTMQYSGNRASSRFHQNIDKAIEKLNKDWRKKEANKLGIYPSQVVDQPPSWTHDQIVAATDFSTWQFILKNQFNNKNRNANTKHLWPKSLGRVFKQYNRISSNAEIARKDLLDTIDEIRNYRNRIFHHEPIWIKASNVVDARTAIDTIRTKINKIESLIETIDNRKLSVLSVTGIFLQARRVCSVEELDLHCGRYNAEINTATQIKTVRKALSEGNDKSTSTITHDGKLYGVYRIR